MYLLLFFILFLCCFFHGLLHDISYLVDDSIHVIIYYIINMWCFLGLHLFVHNYCYTLPLSFCLTLSLGTICLGFSVDGPDIFPTPLCFLFPCLSSSSSSSLSCSYSSSRCSFFSSKTFQSSSQSFAIKHTSSVIKL
jgi:hypothetical protein